MSRSTELLIQSPAEPSMSALALARCIDACIDCAAACTACADACLMEPDIERLSRCISLDISCADICATTARVLSRLHAHDRDLVVPLVQACAKACGTCAVECEAHLTKHAHCRTCAFACRECERACQSFLTATA
ncbi:MAG TPA: four-helix bundle copper-binding protein [Acidimicrobiales bacterium]|nr:four-helix bundle copper-binding protein [Acidimicrobiales bacterium]